MRSPSSGARSSKKPHRSSAGVHNEVGATMDIVNTVVSHNFSALSGGGIGNKGDPRGARRRTSSTTRLQIFGGGILNIGELELTATDVTGNTGAFGWGGGLYNEGTVTLRGSSVSRNTADIEEEASTTSVW